MQFLILSLECKQRNHAACHAQGHSKGCDCECHDNLKRSTTANELAKAATYTIDELVLHLQPKWCPCEGGSPCGSWRHAAATELRRLEDVIEDNQHPLTSREEAITRR